MSTWAQIIAKRSSQGGLPGLELECFPYISGFGAAWRAQRLNCLDLCEIHGALGIRSVSDQSVLQACHRAGATQGRLEDRMGIARTEVSTYWRTQTWSPVMLHGRWSDEHAPLRHCPRCARYGYHATIFQLPSITHCPWHGDAIRDTCKACGAPYRLCPTPDLELGRCVCGNDLFDAHLASALMRTFPRHACEAALSEYLHWAEKERATRHFVSSIEDPVARPGFAHLAKPPMKWNRGPVTPIHERRIGRRPYGKGMSDNHFWGWSQLEPAGPMTLARLPHSTHRRLVAVAQHWFGADSSAFQSDDTMSDPLVLQFARYLRPLSSPAPQGAWVHLSSVDPYALQVCAALTGMAAEHLAAPAEFDGSMASLAQRSAALDRLNGKECLAWALDEVLARGQAQGFDALCRVHLGRRTRLKAWRAPVVELVGARGTLEAIRICWVSANPPHVQPSVLQRGAKKSSGKRRRKKSSLRPATSTHH